MTTLLLATNDWDLVADAAGNIATAAPPYALAQDVASALKLFLGELWYDNTVGVPYFQQVLGQAPPITAFKQYLVSAALTVPGVVSAQCVIQSFANRQVQGQVLFTDSSGNTASVQL